MTGVRIIFALLLLCSFAYAPLFVSLLLVAAYALYFTAYELIVLGLLLDVFYGEANQLPYYLLGALGVFIFAEWIKPRLLMYNR